MALATESQFHVLAVDDSIIDRKLIQRLLNTSSFLVTTVDYGSKALRFLGLGEDHGSAAPTSSEQLEAEVNMVITDYCMPEMTGYDLLKKIKDGGERYWRKWQYWRMVEKGINNRQTRSRINLQDLGNRLLRHLDKEPQLLCLCNA